MRAAIAFLMSFAACISLTSGAVLRVPSEYPTIQLALSAVLNGDTILVAPGEYIESLVAPPIDFLIRGEARIDSQTTEFSVIDPTDLAGSDTLRCVTLTGGKVNFEDIVFRNRSEMTWGRPGTRPAGIVGDTTVREVTFERCIFDSVQSGISQIDRITVKNCRFIGSLRTAVYTGLWRGRLYADSTWFDGATLGLVTAGRGGYIRDCLFTHRGGTRMFLGQGDSLVIERCHFLGLDTLSIQAIQIRPRCGSKIRDCIFENVRYGGSGILEVIDTCFQQQKGWECAIELTNNRFIDCGSPGGNPSSGGEPIYVHCNNVERGFLCKMDSNRVDQTHDIRGIASGIRLKSSAEIMSTIFGDSLTLNKPQIAIEDMAVHDTIYLRLNSFAQDFPGMDFFVEGNSVVDARQNWWGHESGPFHPQNNPAGQGASVDDSIRFIPWLNSDPDTAHHDTSEFVAPTPQVLLSDKFTLSAYPNPFNAVTTLVIEVARAGEYEVLLYDVTGRVAANVFRGKIENRASVSVDASELASGVYFAQLRRADGVLAVGKVLLIR
ncbi:T9SS type A sorting domain-containing protein [bacterium]|nr:T9SS type A sorting domain-containing protein [bacterium]